MINNKNIKFKWNISKFKYLSITSQIKIYVFMLVRYFYRKQYNVIFKLTKNSGEWVIFWFLELILFAKISLY